MMKKLFALMLVLMLAGTSVALAEIDGLTPLEAGMFEGPILLTSVGQSADVNIVGTLLKKIGLEARLAPVVEAPELEGYNTLILAIGGSSKGLGAAGIDENQELARVTALIDAAKEKGVKILSIHIGGQARRGVLSDLFIPDAIKVADAAIIKEDGDSFGDLVISDMLKENGTPAVYIQNQLEAVEPLEMLFTQ